MIGENPAMPSTTKPRTAPAARTAPQRRTPARAKSEQRVRDILRVGREVFAEQGYEHTTTTEIARRLGVSEATVFTYFSGKRELCVRVVSDWYDEITATLAETLTVTGKAPLQEQFRCFVRTHLQLFLVQGTGLCALVLSEGRAKNRGGEETALSDVLVELQRRYTAPLMDLLARGRAAGELREDISLSLMRSLVLGPMEHLLWELVGSHKNVSVETAAEDLTTLIWPALCRPGRELQQLRGLRATLVRALDAA